MESQKLIASHSNGYQSEDATRQREEQPGYGSLRCYGESDMDRSSDVIYLTIGEKSTPRSDEEESRGLTESVISDPMKRAELSAKRVGLSKPHQWLQILIGWQPVVQLKPYQDGSTFQLTLLWKLVNVLYPALIVAVLLTAFFLQYASCYMINTEFLQKKNFSAFMHLFCNSSEKHQQVPSPALPLRCQKSVAGVYILPGVLNLIFYLYSLILNRYVEGEQLPSMIEKVSLQCSSRYFAGYRSHSQLVQSLARFYYLGILWMVVACGLPVLFTSSEYMMLDGINFTFLWTCHRANIALTVLMTAGFVILYLSYTAMLTNYATQTQLMIYLLMGLSERIEDASIRIPDKAISMVNEAAKLLKVVNGHTASCMSLLIVILGLDAVLFVVSVSSGTLTRLDPLLSGSYIAGAIIAVVFIAISLMQASRVTSACNRLKRLGHEVRARPFGYHDASQNALDSFMLYLTTLNIKARLCRIPISKSLLWPISFLLLLAVVLLLQLEVTTAS
ncbi:uncharacterized protein LOC119723652 [Patiria miniata]|uniref:Uncharacterized protein n=1 Tax=Patiria miniata TaxID=46514 RepID=A0A913ZH62_PATMI|nr:uncharacterized protein LOC119723652 [Patiria miniata]XP_038050358.1 uncharacterized protein LOC119723652 [Patiria miniata]XP_038050359.1 uncharacterized protein LOC119723652 [Patiria miniata]XP_038050360.1 uncharacterized protein LOC119723652 [Patiria miniata]